MKDKEKYIEEMAKIMCERCLELSIDNKKCPALIFGEKNAKLCFERKKYDAEYYYNAGYQKIDKDSVLLSREEAERFRGQTINIAKVKSQASKETAEKIFEDLTYIMHENRHHGSDFMLIDESDIRWLAKEYGIEI